jgi:hypothetical protein
MKHLFTLLLVIFFVQLSAQDEAPFTGSLTLEMHTFKKGVEDKDSPMNMYYWSKPDMVLFQPQIDKKNGEMKILVDLKGDHQYMLMTDDKGGKMAMKQKRQKDQVKGSEKESDLKMERTDETKTIDGHLCRKYIGSDKEGTWIGWIAEDLKSPFEHVSGQYAGGKNRNRPENYTDGLPLEMTWESTDKKDKVVMYVRDLKIGSVDESLFDISGYQIMEMPSLPMGGGQ